MLKYIIIIRVLYRKCKIQFISEYSKPILSEKYYRIFPHNSSLVQATVCDRQTRTLPIFYRCLQLQKRKCYTLLVEAEESFYLITLSLSKVNMHGAHMCT